MNKYFPLVADALRKDLEPQGFHVHVRSNDNTVAVTDVATNESFVLILHPVEATTSLILSSSTPQRG